MAVPKRFKQRSGDAGAEVPSESWSSMHEQLLELMKWYVCENGVLLRNGVNAQCFFNSAVYTIGTLHRVRPECASFSPHTRRYMNRGHRRMKDVRRRITSFISTWPVGRRQRCWPLFVPSFSSYT